MSYIVPILFIEIFAAAAVVALCNIYREVKWMREHLDDKRFDE